jgi:hypothetical protein
MMEFIESEDNNKLEKLIYAGEVVRCVLDKKGHGNPIKTCGPTDETDPDYEW